MQRKKVALAFGREAFSHLSSRLKPDGMGEKIGHDAILVETIN